MAYMNNNQFASGTNYLNDNHWENINFILAPETIRILLFKECRLRDRQLIFDSHSSQNSENEAKDEKKNAEEFSHLTEMIFGSTAMKYHDTYYKIHGVSYPDKLIFTQVFSTLNMKKYQANSGSFYSKSNLKFPTCSSLLEYDLNANSLSQSSMDSSPDCFSIFRKNTSTNSTSTTIDSGYSDSSFCSNASFQPSFGSFTRSVKLESSKSSLNFYNSYASDVDSPASISQSINYSRLGLALIVPVTKTKENENTYMQHFTTIESILWRIRQYVELALSSPRVFFVTMFEISSISAKWLSKELNFWTNTSTVEPRENSGGISSRIFSLLNLRKSIFFRQKAKDERFEKFCRTLNEFDVKETKFFLSALLTAVLTHHTGWIASCYLLKDINLNDSYHAIWQQLTNLCGASGFLTKTSKTVIYGLKNNETLNDILDFLCYFIRYFRVERQYINREDISEDNIIINDICDDLRKNKSSGELEGKIKKSGLVKTKKICTDLSQLVERNKENYFNENDELKLSKNKINHSKKKGLSKIKTFGLGMNILNDFNEESDFVGKECNEKPVLFILGDNDKLQNLKKSFDVKDDNLSEHNIVNFENNGSNSTVKLKIIKFPLPKSKYIGDISEIIPHDFLPGNGISDIFVPHKIFQATNVPEKKWKNLLRNDLSLKNSCLFPTQLEENIAILANVDKWEVQVLSSNRNKSEGTIDSCPLVSNILEVVLEMWKLNIAKEQCASFMEQRLVEICLRANALSQFLLTTDFCTTESLLSTLNLNIADVPLLMSVGSNINPEILQKYGLSYQ